MAMNKKKKNRVDELMDLFKEAFAKGKQSQSASVSYPSKPPKASGEGEEGVSLTVDGCVDLDLNSIDLFGVGQTCSACEHAADGLVHSLTTFGKVDVSYIAEVTGKSVREVLDELHGSIFQNPEKFDGTLESGWETADEYLSGNVDEKLRVAREANEQHAGYFDANVRALEEVMPKGVNLRQVHVTLGTPWVPVHMIERFLRFLLGYKAKEPCVTHDELTGSWEIKDKSYVGWYCDQTKLNVTYGTRRLNALQIIEKTLNVQTIKVTDEVTGSLYKKKRVVNEKETLLATDKQKNIVEIFERWIFSDDKRRRELQTVYEEKFCCIRTRRFDGSFLTFPNKSEDIELYPYQRNAVARILFSPNTLLRTT